MLLLGTRFLVLIRKLTELLGCKNAKHIFVYGVSQSSMVAFQITVWYSSIDSLDWFDIAAAAAAAATG